MENSKAYGISTKRVTPISWVICASAKPRLDVAQIQKYGIELTAHS